MATDQSETAEGPDVSVDPALVDDVAEHDRDRYDAARLAPEPAFGDLVLLAAFNLDVARIPWRASEPQVGAIRLRWLIERIDEAYEDRLETPPDRLGPALGGVLAMARRAATPRDALIALVEARSRDLDPTPTPIGSDGEADLDAYLRGTGGAFMRCAVAACLREETAASRAVAEDLGYAHAAARLLEATAGLALRERLLLAVAEDERADVFDGRTTPSLRSAARALADRAAAAAAKARARRAEIDRAAAPALLSAWRVDRVLDRARRPNVDFFVDLGPESEFRRRASLLRRALLSRW